MAISEIVAPYPCDAADAITTRFDAHRLPHSMALDAVPLRRMSDRDHGSTPSSSGVRSYRVGCMPAIFPRARGLCAIFCPIPQARA